MKGNGSLSQGMMGSEECCGTARNPESGRRAEPLRGDTQTLSDALRPHLSWYGCSGPDGCFRTKQRASVVLYLWCGHIPGCSPALEEHHCRRRRPNCWTERKVLFWIACSSFLLSPVELPVIIWYRPTCRRPRGSVASQRVWPKKNPNGNKQKINKKLAEIFA